MRRLIWIPVVVAAGVALWLWGFGGANWVARVAADQQHAVQNAMAGALRRLKSGDMAALGALWALCFSYGFFHAAGPGHGKMVIGGYGLGRRVPMGRLAALAVASSLAQAATAVVLVYAGLLALGWTRDQMQGLADQTLNQISTLAISGIGAWLLWRGLRGLWRMRPHSGPQSGPQPELPQVADFSGLGQPLPHVHDANCGHVHGPTLE